MATINYAVEVYTGTSVTDIVWGLDAGVHRWITGRPGYTGDPTYPTWEDTTNNTHKWYEGFLTMEGMQAPTRSVDISGTGDYGANSGFSFKIANDNLYWKFLQVNEVWLTNRTVKVYCVLDGVFYQIWSGVISNTPYTEQEFVFECVDSFKTLHKELPPKSINETDQPNADESDLGTPIPVAFGNVQYAKMLRYSNLKENVIVLKTYGKEKSMCCAVNYVMDPSNNGTSYAIYIELVTQGKIIHTDELKGCYLQSILGKGADKERLVRILANTETEIYSKYNVNSKNAVVKYSDIYITRIGLEFPIYGTTAGINGAFAWTGSYEPTLSDDTTWWFNVVRFTTLLSAAGGDLSGYNRDERGNLLLYTYDKDLKRYQSATDRIAELSASGNLELTVKASSINADGEITVTTPIPMLCNNAANHPFFTDYTRMSDLSMETETKIGSIGDAADGYTVVGTTIELSPVGNYDYSKISEAYLAPAVHFKAQNHANGHGKVAVKYLYGAVDVYGRAVSIKNKNWYETYTIIDDLAFAAYPDPGVHSTVIPRDYFAINDTPAKMANYNYNGSDIVREGGADSTDTTDSYVARYELCKLPGEILDYLKANMLYYISVVIKTKKGSTQTTNFNRFDTYCPEVGFWGSKSLGSINEDLYVSVKGEKVGTVDSNNVYGAFKLMLETYDGIPTANIDYGNLPTDRIDWPVSRQLTTKRNSYEYLRELAEQSFVCVFSTRTGKKTLSAWRENTTGTEVFSQATMVRNSLKSFENTSIASLYNAFSLQYNWSEATGKYERVLGVSNVDAAAFPESSDTTWRTYVYGVNEGSYADAKALWDICHAAWLKSAAIQPAPDSICKLPWYADQLAAGDTPTNSPGVSTDNSPWLFLQNACEWSTRQKAIATFELPITAANIQKELLEYINFSDELFTDGDLRPGWITGVTHNVREGTITIEATLEPIELDEDITIIERGVFLNIDTIAEAVNQPDTVTETL
jgi:hypothetical protein